jgi:hypothetical protein
VAANGTGRDEVEPWTLAKVLESRADNFRLEPEFTNNGSEKGPALLPRLEQHPAPPRTHRQQWNTRQACAAADIEQTAAAPQERSRRQSIKNMPPYELLTTRKSHQVVSLGPSLHELRVAFQPLQLLAPGVGGKKV